MKTASKDGQWEELQDGGKVRRGDHLPPHKYIRNTRVLFFTVA